MSLAITNQKVKDLIAILEPLIKSIKSYTKEFTEFKKCIDESLRELRALLSDRQVYSGCRRRAQYKNSLLPKSNKLQIRLYTSKLMRYNQSKKRLSDIILALHEEIDTNELLASLAKIDKRGFTYEVKNILKPLEPLRFILHTDRLKR